jgi:septal ring factor EnvC (AmiA/AmiB activator)
MVTGFRALGLAALLIFTVAVTAEDQNPAKAEAELKAIKAQMDKVRADMERDAGKRDQLTKDIEESEKSVGSARTGLDQIRKERAVHNARRAELAGLRRTEETALAKDREALAGQLRAASMIGHEEPLKLLLSQRDPAQTGRVLVYYQYFGRARASQIAAINAHLGELTTLDASMAEEDERLAALEEQQKGQLARLTASRERRGRALVQLEAESKNRSKELDRLKDQQSGLEKLVRELRRALERIDKFPTDSKDAFAKLRGKLAWPVASGRVSASFGQVRAGGVKWDGILVADAQGSPVRAVYHGRVVYADWLSGLGLLTIIDHGDGYLSLYGHAERLYKEVGERVTAGDTIATVGDSGGRSTPALYFEIRKGGKPVDPRPWFKNPAP